MKNFKKTLALALAAAVSVSTVFVASPAETQAASKNAVSVTLSAKAKTSNASISGVKKTLTITTKYNKKAVKAKYSLDSKSKKVVSLKYSGKNIVVTSKKAGTATVTATYTAKKKKYSAKVKVTVTIPTTKLKLNKSKATLKVGKSVTLKATQTPSNTTDKVTWKSSNSKVAAVNKSGKVTAKAGGTATITATSGKKTAKATITVNPTSMGNITGSSSVVVKKTITLKTAVKPTASVVKWTSSNTKVATVSQKGVVTGKKAGTVTITAQSGATKKTKKITVKAATVAVKTVKVTLKNSSINVGATTTATATVTPSNATTKTVTWTSSNKNIATIDKNGKITGKKAGTVTITATSNNKKTGSAKLTVKAVTKKVTGIEIATTGDVKEVDVDSTLQLTATVSPADATTDKTVLWSSKNENIATVDADGLVKGITAGTAEIVATSKSNSAVTKTITITVNPAVDGARIYDGVRYVYSLTAASKVSKGTVTSVVPVVDLINSDVAKLATVTNKAWTMDTIVADLNSLVAKSNNSALLKKAGTTLFAASGNAKAEKNGSAAKFTVAELTYDITAVADKDKVHTVSFKSGDEAFTAEIAYDATSIVVKDSQSDKIYAIEKSATGYEITIKKSSYESIKGVLAKDFVADFTVK